MATVEKGAQRKEVLGLKDIQEFGLGRDLAYRLSKLMPHLTVGRTSRGERIMVRRGDLETLLSRATAERVDLWDLAKTHTPDSLRDWLYADFRKAN